MSGTGDELAAIARQRAAQRHAMRQAAKERMAEMAERGGSLEELRALVARTTTTGATTMGTTTTFWEAVAAAEATERQEREVEAAAEWLAGADQALAGAVGLRGVIRVLIDATDHLDAALRALGHDVEKRPVDLGAGQ